jgi:hypothetical protein
MTRLFIATDDGLAIVSRQAGGWHAEWTLGGKQTHCVAVDPRRSEHVFCGTFDAGVWRSLDAGRSWQRTDGVGGAGHLGIPHPSVMALTVSPAGVVWAGTEPSALFRSDDDAQRWHEAPALRALPSAPTWSFPPRPYTSHVRWLQLDPNDPGRLLASIEAGGVLRSEDGGATWHDRQRDTPRDAHGLAMHPDAPGRVYAATGDVAYAESTDGGRTWRRENDGLRYTYLWSVVVDPGDPETVVVSASPSAAHAHRPDGAESALFRRAGSGRWDQVSAGLPPARGTMTYSLVAAGGALYGAPHYGDVYRSTDAGRTWEPLHVTWHQPDHPRRPYVHALIAVN